MLNMSSIAFFIAVLSASLHIGMLINDDVVNASFLIMLGVFNGLTFTAIYFRYRLKYYNKNINVIYGAKKPWYQKEFNFVFTCAAFILGSMVFFKFIDKIPFNENYSTDIYEISNITKTNFRTTQVKWLILKNGEHVIRHQITSGQYFTKGRFLEVTLRSGFIGIVRVDSFKKIRPAR